eukprot:PhM_4_TR3251/c0_g1_i1/m.74596
MAVVAERLDQELLVQILDGGVLVRLAHRCVAVTCVDELHAFHLDGLARRLRLAATAKAPTGAGHDLNEVIRHVVTCLTALTEAVHQLARVGCTVANGDLRSDALKELVLGQHVREGETSLFDTLHTTYGCDVEVLEGNVTTRHHTPDSTQGSLHDATSCTEDEPSAGRHPERLIEVLWLQLCGVNAALLQQFGELAGREDIVNVRDTVRSELRARLLGLLCHARHNGDGRNVLGLDTDLLGIVMLRKGTTHLLRGFARAEVVEEVMIVLFTEEDPTGGARCDHGQRRWHMIATELLLSREHATETLEQLEALFDDGEIGSEVDIEDLHVLTKHSRRRDHLVGEIALTGGTTKLLS